MKQVRMLISLRLKDKTIAPAGKTWPFNAAPKEVFHEMEMRSGIAEVIGEDLAAMDEELVDEEIYAHDKIVEAADMVGLDPEFMTWDDARLRAFIDNTTEGCVVPEDISHEDLVRIAMDIEYQVDVIPDDDEPEPEPVEPTEGKGKKKGKK